MPERNQHNLRNHIVVFCRALRDAGIPVGPGSAIDALHVLQKIPLQNRHQVRQTLQMIFAKHPEEIVIFQRVFERYWLVRPGMESTSEEEPPTPSASPEPEKSRRLLPQLSSLLQGQEVTTVRDEVQLPGYSPYRVLTRRDFAHFSEAEQAEMLMLVQRMARSLAVQFSRRMRSVHQQARFDFRKTLRHNLRRGGEIVQLHFMERIRQRLKLVVLCDVSKSMDLYSRFLLQFLIAFSTVYHRTELFVFSTSLVRLTNAIQEFRQRQDWHQLFGSFQEWSGGTRIGESLQQFVREFGPMIDSRTVVLILSDGWDTGSVELLRENMAYLYRHSAFVMWLNPLMGFSEYRPETRGMQAALPYIDILAPVHNLDSLRQMVHQLTEVYSRRVHRSRKKDGIGHTFGKFGS